jgi:hypothetical protein
VNDPIDEIFNGTPDGIDEKELKEMNDARAVRREEINQIESPEEGAQSPPSNQGSQPKEQKTEPSTGGAANETKENETLVGARTAAESVFAIPTGALDFGVDVINLIPGVDAPKLPKFHNDALQSVRDISSVLLPSVGIIGKGTKLLGAAAKTSKAKFLADPAVKKIGEIGFAAGAGAAVDSISEQSEGDNLTGTLKQMWPRTYAWIPDNIATLDGESPEAKRIKNVTEGVGLGVVADILGNFGILAKNLKGVDESTKWIPESEKSGEWFKKNLKPQPKDAEEAVVNSAAARSDALDELGTYNFSKSQNLDEAQLGVHDLYGYEESGTRSVDNLGIVGASVDAARIRFNADSSYGRLGSVISEPAMKIALEGVEEYDYVMKGLKETLQEADDYAYRTSGGKTLNSKQIREVGEQMAAEMMGMDKNQLKLFLSRFQSVDFETGNKVLTSDAAVGVKIAMKKMMKDFADLDTLKTRAYVETSLSGQVSDMAQGMRYSEGSAAYQRAQDQILDRLEFLMIQNGQNAYVKGRGLNLLNVFKRNKNFTKKTAEDIKKDGLEKLKDLKAEAKQTIDTLRSVKDSKPEMLGPFMLAYELTDGKVSTIHALNNYIRNSTGVFKKALIDGSPEVESAVMRGFWANVYNSTLSALGTPIKAGFSNLALLVERPIATFAGAVATGDMKTIKRGLYQYGSMFDTLQKGMQYMGQTFQRSGIDPYYAGVAGRDDLIMKNEEQLTVLKAFADAKAVEGDFGPQAMYEQIEAINDLANHPWLRFGTRAMQAFDGFTQAVVGNIEARGRAFDLLADGKIDEDLLEAAAKKAYKDIWDVDEKGRAIISDKAVKYAAGEIAMNLDNAANDALSYGIRKAPGIKPFLLFTKTPVNILKFTASHNPVGLFIDQVNAFSRPFKEMPMDRVKELLTARGVPIDENMETAYNAIRAELKGRKAIGTLAVMAAVGLYMNGKGTGYGLYDREKNQFRKYADKKPLTIEGPGGSQISYDNLGGLTDWAAMTFTILDNFDQMDEGSFREQLNAMAFVLASAVTDRTMLAGIEPLYDMLNGNIAAINRFASGFLPSATMPGSSQIAELTRLLAPELRVMEENLIAMVMNRTPLKGTLPTQTDWIDGGAIGTPSNPLARIYNTYAPNKINGKPSELKTFLADIEYDARPNMKTDGKGVDLTLMEQARVYDIMGQDGYFRQKATEIMNRTDSKEFRKKFFEFRKNDRQPRLEDFEELHIELDKVFNEAKARALGQLDEEMSGAIEQRRFDQNLLRKQNKLGSTTNDLLLPHR